MREYYRKNSEKIKERNRLKYQKMKEENSEAYWRKLEMSSNYYNMNRKMYRDFYKASRKDRTIGTGNLGEHRDPDFDEEKRKLAREFNFLRLRR
jgi:RNA-splicing ligase RtcB